MNYKKYIEENRFGKFDVSRRFIESMNKEQADIFFGSMIVVRAEMMLFRSTIEYTAVSPLFDIVEEGGEPSYYLIDIDDKMERKIVKL